MSAADRRRNFQDLASLAKTGSMAPVSSRSVGESAPSAPGSMRVPASVHSVGAGALSGPLSSRLGPQSQDRAGEDSGLIDLNAAFGSTASIGAESAANSFAPAPLSSTPLSSAATVAATLAPAAAAPTSVSTFSTAPNSAAAIPTPASLRLAAEAPLSSPVLASQLLPQIEEPSVGLLAATALASTTSASAVSSLPVAATAAADSQTSGERKSKTGVLLIGGLAFACAAAAATLMYVRQTPVPETKTPIAAVVAPTKPAAKTDRVDTNPLPGATDPVAAGVDNVAALPMAKDPVANNPAKPGVDPKLAVGAAPALVAGALAAKPDLKVEKPVAEVTPSGPAGDLGSAMRVAAGPIDNGNQAKVEGPQFAAGTVPQKPSQGALTSAVSGVLGAARACIPEDGAIARASITFASAGNVQSVSASGPQAECVKAALSKAHVAPFAEPTFTMPVTVRH